MTVKVTDVAGNVSASSPSVVVTIDITAPAKTGTPVLPAVYDTGRSATDKITSITTPTLTGTTTAATTVSVYDGGIEIASVYSPTTAWSLSLAALADGSHTITTKASDAAGNLSVVSTAIVVVVDTIAPPAASLPVLVATTSDTGRSTTDRITFNTKPVFAGTNESKALVKLYEADTQLGTVTTTVATYSVTSSVLGEGPHTVFVTATDVAGNLGPASTPTTITIDTTAPPAPSLPVMNAASDTGVSTTDRLTKQTKPVFLGTSEDNASVRLYDGTLATGTAGIATAGGDYSASATTALTNGLHTISARATDVAGNTSGVLTKLGDHHRHRHAHGHRQPGDRPGRPHHHRADRVHGGLQRGGRRVSSTPTSPTPARHWRPPPYLSGSSPTFGVLASGMTKTGTVIAAVAATKVTDLAGNANTASTTTDNTVTYNDILAPDRPLGPGNLGSD